MTTHTFHLDSLHPGACFEYPIALRHGPCVTAWFNDEIHASLLAALLNGWRQRGEHARVLMAHLAGEPPHAPEARLSYEVGVVPLIPGYATPLKYEGRVLAWFRNPALVNVIVRRVDAALDSLAHAYDRRSDQSVMSRRWLEAMLQADLDSEIGVRMSA